MDLAALVSDKQLLAGLTREYELLRASNASLNYEEWISRRLQLAAASKGIRVHYSATPPAATELNAALAQHLDSREAGSGIRKPHQHILAPDSRIGAKLPSDAACQQERPHSAHGAAVQRGQQEANVCPSEGHQQWTKPGPQAVSGAAPYWPASEAHASANLLPQGAPGRAATQPQWVAAARLQSSLQSSGVVPLMHAAAERDRTLAATSALVRQQMAVGSQGSGSISSWQQLCLQQQQHQWQQQLDAGVGTSSLPQEAPGSVAAACAEQQPRAAIPACSAAGVVPAVAPGQQQQNTEHLHQQEAELLNATADAAATAVAVQPASTQAQEQQQQQQQQGQPSQQQQPLPEAVSNSWLLRSVLQPHNGRPKAAPGASVDGPAAPEFIRIAGEAGVKPAKQQQQQQVSKQPGASDRRSQLKAALKQLLSSSNGTGQQQAVQGVVGLLQGLLGQQQQQQQEQQGMFHGQQQQLQEVAVQLERLLQGFGSKQAKQQRQQHRQQDENAVPWEGIPDGYSPPHSSAKQHLLQRQQQRQQRQLQKAASAVNSPEGHKKPHKQQQQQRRQRERPAWQSEVYVPPPVHLLKRKNAGFADAWGTPADRKLPPVRPISANKSRPSSASKAGQRPRPQQEPSRRQQQRSQHGPSGQHIDENNNLGFNTYTSTRRSLSPVHESSSEQLDARDLLAAAVKLNSSSAGGCQQQDRSSNAAESAPTAAAPAVRAPQGHGHHAWGFNGLSAGQVQGIEQQVQQQLQQEKEQAEANRLTRLEETASHILGVLGRLEQQLQQPAPTVAAGTTNHDAAAAPTAAAAESNPLQEPHIMADMLQALERMEAQEREIRSRWFARSDLPAAAAVRKSADVTNTQSADSKSKGRMLVSQQDQAPTAEAHDHITAVAAGSSKQDTGLDALATAATANAITPHSHQQQQQQQECLGKETLRSIKAGRRKFLKHQAAVDGQLEVLHSESPSPTFGFSAGAAAAGATASGKHAQAGKQKGPKQQLQPTLVVEAVADLLLDELLLDQVQELDGFMDALCDQLFEEEFIDA